MALDVIGSGLITVTPDDSLGEALFSMRSREIHHLIVLESGRVAGVLSDRDILSKGFDQDTMRLNPALKVRDIMTMGIPVLDEGTSFGDALAIMQDRNLSALPIRRGSEIGIVTETDFLRVARKLLRNTHKGSLGGQLDVELSSPLVQSVMKLLSDIGI